MIGHYSAGTIVKRVNRIPTLRVSSFSSVLFALLLTQTTGYFSFSLVRLCSGFFHGIIYTIRASIPVEITPTKHRSLIITFIASGGISFAFAGIISVYLGETYLENFETGNWINIVFGVAFSLFVSAFLISLYIEDSARHLLTLSDQ